MATVDTNALKQQLALAERQVMRDQAQVAASRARLQQNESQLTRDRTALSSKQNEMRVNREQHVQVSGGSSSASDAPKSQAAQARPTVNANGESIGTVLHAVA